MPTDAQFRLLFPDRGLWAAQNPSPPKQSSPRAPPPSRCWTAAWGGRPAARGSNANGATVAPRPPGTTRSDGGASLPPQKKVCDKGKPLGWKATPSLSQTEGTDQRSLGWCSSPNVEVAPQTDSVPLSGGIPGLGRGQPRIVCEQKKIFCELTVRNVTKKIQNSQHV